MRRVFGSMLLVGCHDYGWGNECDPVVVDRFGRGDVRFGVSADELIDEVNGWGPIDARFEPAGAPPSFGFDDALTLEVEPRGRAMLVDIPGPGQCGLGGSTLLRIEVDLWLTSALGFEGTGRGSVLAASEDLERDVWVDGSTRTSIDGAPQTWTDPNLTNGCNGSGPTAVQVQFPHLGSVPEGGSSLLASAIVFHVTETETSVCFQSALSGE